MARALRAFLLVTGRRDQVAAVLLRAADVDESALARADPAAHFVPVRADVEVAIGRGVRRRLRRGCLRRQLAPLVDPLLAAPVEDPHVLVAVDLQVPVGVGGKPVVLVAVEHERRVVRDPALAQQALEGRLVDQVALDRIL